MRIDLFDKFEWMKGNKILGINKRACLHDKYAIVSNDVSWLICPTEHNNKYVILDYKVFSGLAKKSGFSSYVDEETNKIIIEGKSTKIELAVIDENAVIEYFTVLFEDFEIVRDKKYKRLPSEFYEAVKIASSTRMEEQFDFQLNYLFYNGKEKEFVSSDNLRITRYKIDLGKESFSLHPVSLQILDKYKPKQYYIGDKFIVFKHKEYYLGIKKIESEFYSYLEYFDKKDFELIEITNVDELREAVEMSACITMYEDMPDKKLTIRLRKNRILVDSSSDVGTIKNKLSNKREQNKDFVFTVNPHYFMDVLNIGDVKILFNEVKKILYVTGNNFERLIALHAE